jgi:hypothetical protein
MKKWDDGRMGKSFLNSGKLELWDNGKTFILRSKPNLPIFQYSIIPHE